MLCNFHLKANSDIHTTTKNYSILGDGAKLKKKYHIDTVSLNFPKKDMEVETYMKDGMIDNWDVFEKVTMKELL